MLRLFPFCILFLILTTEVSVGQVTLDANGNAVLGAGAPTSAHRVRIVPASGSSNSVGLYIGSPQAGTSRHGLQIFTFGQTGISRGIFARGSSVGGANVYGVYAEARNGHNGYAIYGFASGSSNVEYAGYFNGDVLVTGTFSNPSDARLKERAEPLAQADVLSRLLQLAPQSYYFRTSPEYAHMGLPSARQYGLIAQDVEAVFPELVRTEVQPPAVDDVGQEVGASIAFKSVDYMKLIPLLVAALQEQQRRIEALEAALQE